MSLHANLNGGSGGTVYTWSGLPLGCGAANASAITCTPTTAGTFVVTVYVVDSNGQSGSSSIVISVESSANEGAGPSGNAFLGLPAGQAYLILAVIATAIAIGLAGTIYLTRKRRSAPPRKPPSP